MNLELAQSFRYDLNFTYQEKDGTVRVFKEFSETLKLATKVRFDIVKQLGLDHVPIIEAERRFNWLDRESVLLDAEGMSVLNKDTDREGFVFKAIDGSHSFKVISNRFLLRYKI